MRYRALALPCVMLLAGCGGSSTPAHPTPAPAPTPAPTPVPTPTPNAYAVACGTPLPNPDDMYGFAIKVQVDASKFKKVLNASPIVRNGEYCLAAGQPGSTCHTRNEENPERVPCDYYMSGIAQTGNPGPDWYEVVNGRN